jgi:hypothetical protein
MAQASNPFVYVIASYVVVFGALAALWAATALRTRALRLEVEAIDEN